MLLSNFLNNNYPDYNFKRKSICDVYKHIRKIALYRILLQFLFIQQICYET